MTDQAAAAADGAPEQDFLGMSDEEFAKVDTAFLAIEDEGDVDSADSDDSAGPAADLGDEGADDDSPGGDSDDDGVDGDDDAEDLPAGAEGDVTDPHSGDDAGDGADDDPDDKDGESGDEGDDSPVDYKALYEQVTAPFKANGKEMKVDGPEDVVRLMQMGANYNRKMGAMKPHLKTLKVLETNGISDEKLGFLIDLDKKDPTAIAKLLKDSKIDPLDLNLEEDSKYQATDYSVDDSVIDLDTAVDEIKDSPTYTKTIDIVGNKWDAASKQIVAKEPHLLSVIDTHVANGVYEVISTEVEKKRMFGQLTGMSDIEAYKSVGDELQESGGFNHLFQPEQGSTKTPAPDEITPAQKAQAETRKNKRRAASPTKAAPSKKGAQDDFNPLSMSDDEYMKQFDPNLL
jgi:hypothetical protein